MNKSIFVSTAVLAMLCLLFVSSGYSETADDKTVKTSFETLLKKMIEYGSQTISEPYKTQEGYRLKKWGKSENITYDIRKSDSIISPYIGVMELPANSCVTAAAPSPESIVLEFECKKIDGKVGLKDTGLKQKYQFAYQEGKWQLKQSNGESLTLKAYDNKFGKTDISEAWNGDNFLNYIFNADTVRRLQE